MNAAARPPEGDASSRAEAVAQRPQGRPVAEIAQLHIAAALLACGRLIHALSCGLTLIALAAAGYAGFIGSGRGLALCAAVALAGLLQCWFALRVAFDAALFDALCEGRGLDANDMAGFDAAMQALDLLPAHKAGRDWRLRCAGALRLLRWQIGLACLQAVLWLLGLAVLGAS